MNNLCLYRVEPSFNIYLQCFGFFLLSGVAGVGGGISSKLSLSKSVGEDLVSNGLILRSGEAGGLSCVLARSPSLQSDPARSLGGLKPWAGSGSKPIETEVPVRWRGPLPSGPTRPTGSKNPKFLRASKVLLDFEPNPSSSGAPACRASSRRWNGLRISSLSFFSLHRWADEFTGERKSRTAEPGLRAARASPGSPVWFP